VIIAPDGYILTNDHVVHIGKGLRVTVTDGTNIDAWEGQKGVPGYFGTRQTVAAS